MIYEWKRLVENKYWAKDSEGNKTPWSKIREIHVDGKQPGILFHKIDYDATRYSKLDLNYGGPTGTTITYENLLPAYSGDLHISKDKIADLIRLCDTNVIPKDYQPFYRELAVRNEKAACVDRQHIVEEREVQSKPLKVKKKASKKALNSLQCSEDAINSAIDPSLSKTGNTSSSKNKTKVGRKRKAQPKSNDNKKSAIPKNKGKIGGKNKTDTINNTA